MYDQVLGKKNKKGHFWPKIGVFIFFHSLKNFLISAQKCTFLFTMLYVFVHQQGSFWFAPNQCISTLEPQ